MATKYLKLVNGTRAEGVTVSVSAGAGDVDKIPSLNASGVLDDSITNASATSSANKIVKMNGSGIIAPAVLNGTQASAGAGDAAKVVQLDSTGKIDSTMMPTGIAAETVSATATEALAAGDLVNIYNSSGIKCRKADASNGRQAHGFVLASVSNTATASIYLEGTNTQVSGRTPGATQFLSGSSPGSVTETPPSTAGYILQIVGYATGTTQFTFEDEQPVTLA